MNEVLKSFLVSIGFAADDSSARRAESTIKRVEKTAVEADKRREKTSAEARMNEAKAQLEAEGVIRPSMDRIAKRAGAIALAEREAANKRREHEKAQAEYHAQQEKRQARNIEGLRKLQGVALGTAVAIKGATLAMAGYATFVAGRLEEMAYASDRTGSSIKDLKIFSQSVSQLGGTRGGALNAIEGFAERLRRNPEGYAGFLKSVGVDMFDAKGNAKGATQLAKEFRKNVGERFKYGIQLQYADEMGIDEQTWRATDPARLEAEEAAQRAKYARLGHDPDKAADDAKNLQHALRDMWDSINIIGEKTASKIFGDVGGNLKSFTTFLEQNGDKVADILAKIAQVVLAVTQALLDLLTSDAVRGGLDSLLGMFGKVDESTGKWTADTERIKDALTALAVFVGGAFVAKIVAAFLSVTQALGPLMTMLAPFLGPLLGTAAIGGALIGLSDPSKGLTHGGKPGGALNPGDELPGLGAGPQGGGEGAWSRFKRGAGAIGRALGFGGGGAAAKAGPEGVAYNATSLKEAVGINDAQYSAYLEGLTDIEGKRYTQVGGAGGRYSGRYQFGPNEIAQTARELGEKPPTREAFLADPTMQERFMERYTLGHHNYLMQKSEAYRNLSAAKKLEILGYAHNQGAGRGGALTYLETGRVGSDGFGTAGTAYFRPIRRRLEALGDGMGRLDMEKLREIGAATKGFNPGEYFKSAPPLGSSSSSTIRNQSFTGGSHNTTIQVTNSDTRGIYDIWKRHDDRQSANDMRHGSSVFAAG